MPMRIAKCFLVAVLLAAAGLAHAEDARIEAAKQLFEQFVKLERAHDPALADLYADEALITSRRTFPMGSPRDSVIPAGDYKQMLRQRMPAAQATNDLYTYSKVTYALEGESVRIKAARFSAIKGRTSPISLLAGGAAGGKWLIYEELAESRQ